MTPTSSHPSQQSGLPDVDTPAALRLQREDLVAMEPLLAAALGRFVPFTAHSLYFPTAANTPDGPQWLSQERTLLLPLIRRQKVLGVFTARGVDGRTAKRLLPVLPALAELCLDNLELTKQSRCDHLTGLPRGRELLARMVREADAVRSRFWNEGDEDMGPLHRVCMGLLVVRCHDWRALAAEHGYAFADALMVELTAALAPDHAAGRFPEALPPELFTARMGEGEFALLLPAGGRGACGKLAHILLRRLDSVRLPHPVTQRPVRPCCAIGHAQYPQDMDAPLLPLPMSEQARVLLHKARLAADVALERFTALLESQVPCSAEAARRIRTMACGHVLAQGGVLRRLLPDGRVEISLGRHTGAVEGLRFAVWGTASAETTKIVPVPSPVSGASGTVEAGVPHVADPTLPRRHKGELILVEVRESASAADILHLNDPADTLEPGDTLTLLHPSAQDHHDFLAENDTDTDTVPHTTASGVQDATTTPSSAFETALPLSMAAATPAKEILPGHGDFVRQLPRLCEGHAAFTLVLVRLTSNADDLIPLGASPQQQLRQLHTLCRRFHQGETAEQAALPLLAARYGETSLAFFHPAALPGTAQRSSVAAARPSLYQVYAQISRAAVQEGLSVAVGLASWPNLGFARGDALECCRKALDLALLLPEPRVGVFGSLALNISADKRYSRGDVFGAVEEYKLALLADKHNGMAWNSLGVCMAALSQHQDARGYFTKALHSWKKALRDVAQGHARDFLPSGSTLESEHAAALYNLGTVCQNLGEKRAAARHFRQCLLARPDHYFARLRLGQLAEEGGRSAQARTHYTEAAHLEEQCTPQQRQQEGVSPGLALRHLARLALRSRKAREARELLHEALLRNPQDAAAMSMLAQLCLDGGEDPGMAEMLARKSLNLRPGHAPTGKLLARALRALGREEEAATAEASLSR